LARQKFVTAQIGELLILPWGSLLLMGTIAIISPQTLTPEIAILGNLVAAGSGLIVLIIQTRKSVPPQLKSATPVYSSRAWLVAAFPMLIVSGMQVVNQRVGILMVGDMLGAEEAGIYAVANGGVMFVALIFFAVNQPLAPVIARLFAERKMDRLQNVLVRAARISLMAAVPVGLLIIVFATPFLRLYGEEFPVGRVPMIIMTIGYVITMGFGSVSAALTMTGFERMAAVGIGVSVVLNIGLNLLLIPRFGMTGAAWALATGQVSSAVLMTIFTFRFLKINNTATGRTL
ncbi:MAG TPA: hypothetical protein ENH10_00110, partial [Bacteroidetes bacterium]|nr:hypothetical protein [Bacteroidota bacterium]HEX03549.1 hypothetical protein [Bacteroidota bacterium]